ncbi:hypothetical protein [Kitasatospora camelliae]|uniref:Transglutaminase superfamily protein n=1 Tax=Kitasatospora camelliae TaxID=3156397 RepID=A0AAU8K3L3_9ACTN
MTDEVELRRREYDARIRAARLRQEAFASDDGGSGLDDLVAAERELADLAGRSAAARTGEAVVLDTRPSGDTLGPASTGIGVVERIRMRHLPTAFCHLLEARLNPLVSVTLRRYRPKETRRLRVSCAVDGYSATAVETVELDTAEARTVDLLPTFHPAALAAVTELTRATLGLQVEDLDGPRTEVHRTTPIWLLARDTAPFQTLDPATGAMTDLTRYLGAFVTPHAPEVVEFTRRVADRHPERRLMGYQGTREAVEAQVRAVYEAVAEDLGLTYVNSAIAFNPEEGAAGQRVRLPRESLRNGVGNCLDGTVLLASLLENLSLRPEIVLVPGHALVGWEDWPDLGTWSHLDTTVAGGFERAVRRAAGIVSRYEAGQAATGDTTLLRRWPIRDLRAAGITPMG